MSFDEFVKYVKTYIEPIIEKNKRKQGNIYKVFFYIFQVYKHENKNSNNIS